MSKTFHIFLKTLLAVLIVFFSLSSRGPVAVRNDSGLSISTGSGAAAHAFPLFQYSSRRYSANRLVEISSEHWEALGPVPRMSFVRDPAPRLRFAFVYSSPGSFHKSLLPLRI